MEDLFWGSNARPARKWSAEDEISLIEGHIKFGSKWVSIAKQIPGARAELEVKNHWYSTLRSKTAIRSGKKPSLLYCYASLCASSEAKSPEQRQVLLERAREISDLPNNTGGANAPTPATSFHRTSCPGFFSNSSGFQTGQTEAAAPMSAAAFPNSSQAFMPSAAVDFSRASMGSEATHPPPRTSCPGFFRTSEGFHHQAGGNHQSVTDAFHATAAATAAAGNVHPTIPYAAIDFSRASVGSEASHPPPRTSCPGFFRTSEGFHYHTGNSIQSDVSGRTASQASSGTQPFARLSGGYNPFSRSSHASSDASRSQVFARESGGTSNPPYASFNRDSNVSSEAAAGSQIFARESDGSHLSHVNFNRLENESNINALVANLHIAMSRVPEDVEGTMSLLEQVSLDPQLLNAMSEGMD